jgi:hypothetical protein
MAVIFIDFLVKYLPLLLTGIEFGGRGGGGRGSKIFASVQTGYEAHPDSRRAVFLNLCETAAR